MKVFPALAAALCLALPTTLLSQENVLYPSVPTPITYGVEAGMNVNTFSQTITRSREVPDSPFDAYGEGMGFSPYAFFFVDYALSNSVGLQLKVGLDRKRFGNGRTGTADCILMVDGQPELDIVQMRLDYDVTSTFITLGASGRFDVTRNLVLTAGPVFHVRIDSTDQIERFRILSEGPCEFLDPETGEGLGKYIEQERRIQSSPTARLGLELAAGYRIAMDGGYEIIPTLRLQYMLTELIEDRPSQDQYRSYSIGTADVQLSNTTLHSAQLGVAILFDM